MLETRFLAQGSIGRVCNQAFSCPVPSPGVDDTVTVLLQYPGGIHGSFTCSISAQLSNMAFVSGTKGIGQVRHDWLCWELWPLATASCGCWSRLWPELVCPHSVAKESILDHQDMDGMGSDLQDPS